jgi:hypothetical protein
MQDDHRTAFGLASQSLLDEVSERLLAHVQDLIKSGAPEDAAGPAVGVLVSLLRAKDHDGTAAIAAAAGIYSLVSRGKLGDTVREAGGIPLLLSLLTTEHDYEEDDGRLREYASGALAHLAMQREANREALVAAGGVPVLAALASADAQQPAEYASSTLGTLAMCGPAHAATAVRAAAGALPDGSLGRYPHLELTLATSHADARAATWAGVRFERWRGRLRAGALCASLVGEAMRVGGACTTRVQRALRHALADWRVAHARAHAHGNAPADFVCAITHDVMREPAVASDGFS